MSDYQISFCRTPFSTHDAQFRHDPAHPHQNQEQNSSMVQWHQDQAPYWEICLGTMPCTGSAGLPHLLNLKQATLNKDTDYIFKSALHFNRECNKWLRACFKMLCLLKQPVLLQDCSPQQEFASLKWKETRLHKTFITMFEYLTLDHRAATHQRPLKRKEMLACSLQKEPVSKMGAGISHNLVCGRVVNHDYSYKSVFSPLPVIL